MRSPGISFGGLVPEQKQSGSLQLASEQWVAGESSEYTSKASAAEEKKARDKSKRAATRMESMAEERREIG